MTVDFGQPPLTTQKIILIRLEIIFSAEIRMSLGRGR
jgi:hypothetical protein